MVLILRRVRSNRQLKPATAGGPPVDDDPTLARYRAAIEKDTERLD